MKKLLLLLALLCPTLLFAQGSQYQAILLGPTGRPLAGAVVTVCAFGSIGVPCQNPINLFSDPGLSVPQSNPTTSDSLGNWGFWALPNNYVYTVTGPGVKQSGPFVISVPCNLNSSCSGTTSTFANLPVSPVTNALAIVTDGNGNDCLGGGGTIRELCQWTGTAWVLISAPVSASFPVTPANGGTGTPTPVNHGTAVAQGPSNPFHFVTPSANSQCYMSDAANFGTADPSFQTCPSGGGGGSPSQGSQGVIQGAGPTAGTFQVSQLSEASGVLNNGDDNVNRGPNPNGVDVRFFGARPINPNIVPAPTATTNSGSPTVTVSSTSGLKKGDGFDVVGGGSAQTMTTPTAPTVTPSCAANLTGLGLTVPVPGGATAYAYSLSLIDQGRGWTAASVNGTTSTGNATLGARSTAVTSIASGATNTFTATVASTAELATGCLFELDSTTDDGEYGGWHTIASIVDGTHFTYTSGVDASRGISATTATGGTVHYWLCNHIVLPTPGAGGTQYMVFGNTSGSMAYLGLSLIANLGYTDVSYNTYDDYGSTMMANPTKPWWAPSTPPGSPVNDLFVATITNIAGNTLTMSANAGTSVSSSPARFDNVPAILAAQAASNTFSAGGGGALRFPVPLEDGSNDFSYVISSPLTITNKSVISDATLNVGDTITMSGGEWIGTELGGIRQGSVAFGMRQHSQILGAGANPMVILQNGAGIDNTTVLMFGNNAVGVLNTQQNSSQLFRNDAFGSQSATSYLAIPFYDYSPIIAGSFGGDFRDTNFSCGYSQVSTSPPTPAFVTKFGSQWNFDTVYMNRCGVGLFPSSGSTMFRFVMGHEIQGNIGPLVTIGNINTGTGANNVPILLNIKNGWVDTGQSLLGNFSSSCCQVAGHIVVDTADIQNNYPLITGQLIGGSIDLIGLPNTPSSAKLIGQNVNVNNIGGIGLGSNSVPFAGISAAAYAASTVSYAVNHTINGQEGVVIATASGITFTLPHAQRGEGWDIFNQSAGTITLTIDSGTLFGGGATGPITIPANSGLHATCDGTNCNTGGSGNGGGCSPGGTVNALQSNNGAGGCQGLNAPTVPGDYIVHYPTPTTTPVAPARDLPGVPINVQTGTTYTEGSANYQSDRGFLTTANNAGAQTYTMGNPSAAGFGQNYFNVLHNIGTAAVTENASGFTVNGGASLLVPPGWVRYLWSDGVNYRAARFADFGAFPNCTGGGNALQFTSATGVFSCGASSSGVSSITGDSAFYNNSLSTGAVTLTLANAGAHKVWMNNTGIGAIPGYQSIGEADLPATTVFTDKANTMGAFLFDLSASTLNLPTVGGFTASATSKIGYDSTNKNAHIYQNNADALVLAIPSAPATGNLADYVVATSNVLAHDSGIATANVVTNSTGNAAAANQVIVSGGANKTVKAIDFPERYFIPAANCNNTTAGAGWSIGSGGTVGCRAGTNNLGGFVTITDTTATFAQFMVTIPVDWDTATNPYIKFYLASASDTTNGHTVIPQIKVSCPTAGNGTVSDDATFSAAQSSSTVTFGASAVANGFYNGSNVQIGSTQMTGCIAGGMMIVQVGRATDTATGNINFYGADVTFPRLIVVQAN